MIGMIDDPLDDRKYRIYLSHLIYAYRWLFFKRRITLRLQKIF